MKIQHEVEYNIFIVILGVLTAFKHCQSIWYIYKYTTSLPKENMEMPYLIWRYENYLISLFYDNATLYINTGSLYALACGATPSRIANPNGISTGSLPSNQFSFLTYQDHLDLLGTAMNPVKTSHLPRFFYS